MDNDNDYYSAYEIDGRCYVWRDELGCYEDLGIKISKKRKRAE